MTQQPRRFRRRPVTSKLIVAVMSVPALFGIISVMPAGGVEPPADGPPKGYASELLVKLAIATGQLELVDRDIPVPDSIQVTRGIEYGHGGDDPLHLDLYSPKNLKESVPAIILIHGGGWRGGKREDYHYYCVRFAERGYVVASISYRLIKTALFPAAVEDAKCAVRWLRSNAGQYHVNPDLIGVAGGSAGGHLSMMVGYSSDNAELEGNGGHPDVSSRVQAVVNLYGPADLTTEYGRTHSLVTNFIGRSYEESPELYRQASPLTHISPDDPPTLTFQGTIDSLVPVSQADALHKRLQETQVTSVYERLEGWPHTMDAAQVVNDYCVKRMLAFFEEHLGRPAIPVKVPKKVAPITIDGDFEDWKDFSAYSDPPGDTHDTENDQKDAIPDPVDHPDADLLEYRVTHDDENLYFYVRSRGEIGRTQKAGPDKRAGRYYVAITIDVDNNDDTGYWIHEGGYYPTSRGYDVNAEIEYYDGEFNTGHYLNHGARNESELKQAFLDQTQGKYVAGNDGPYPAGFMRVLPGTYDFYTQWVYHSDDTITIVRDKGPAVHGIVKSARSKDRHELEVRFPLKGFLPDENGDPVVSPGTTIDISVSLEASGELAPGQRWASDTAEPLENYKLN